MLELRSFQVRTAVLGEVLRYAEGTLTIDRAATLAMVEADPAFSSVELTLVSPGQPARITQVTDVVEPRVKVGSAGIFPGTLGPVEAVGTGRTNRLAGVAVVVTGEVPWLGAKGLFVAHDNVLDTGGPGAELSPYAGLHLVVLRMGFTPGVDHEGYQRAMLLAGLKVARALAEATLGAEPTSVETRDLTPVPGLPTVAYAYQVQSQGVFMRTHLQGRILDELLPTVVDPNEIADGVLVTGGLGGHGARVHTWMHQNNPILAGLVRRHGTVWNLGGVILHRGHFYLYEDKQRVALRIVQTAAVLGARGVIFTLGGIGNNVTETMLAIQECERRGIATVLVTWEHGGRDGADYPLPFAVTEAVAMVSTGNIDEPLHLPRPARVVGGSTIRVRPEVGGEPLEIGGELDFERRTPFVGAANPLGFQRTGSRAE